MRKLTLCALLCLCFFPSKGFAVEVFQEKVVVNEGLGRAMEFRLKNNDAEKLKVNIEVRKLVNGMFENVSDDFSIPRNKQSIKNGDDLSVKLLQLVGDCDSALQVVFRFTDNFGKLVSTKIFEVPSISKKFETTESFDNLYKIVKDKGVSKVVSVRN